jgi:hypothetical protein
MNRDSSVGIATGYRLIGQGLIPDSETHFSLLHSVQTDSGSHTTPFQWVPGILSPGVKRLGRGSVHSPPTNAEVKNDGTVDPVTTWPHGLVLH